MLKLPLPPVLGAVPAAEPLLFVLLSVLLLLLLDPLDPLDALDPDELLLPAFDLLVKLPLRSFVAGTSFGGDAVFVPVSLVYVRGSEV